MTLPSGEANFFPPAGISLILSAGTVWAGRTAQDKPITEALVISGVFIVLATAVVHTMAPGFADAFSMLIFVAVFLAYGLDILISVGIATQNG
jgi:hypothetical protein